MVILTGVTAAVSFDLETQMIPVPVEHRAEKKALIVNLAKERVCIYDWRYFGMFLTGRDFCLES